MSFPLDSADDDRFESVTETSSGKLVRLDEPETWLLAIVIVLR
jgi:hypothetical protein